MRPGGIQHTPHEEVRLVPAGEDWCLQAQIGGEWADVYRFDQCPQLGPDYAQQNWYTATQPQSLFRHNVIVTRPVPGGRYALFNRTLTWRPLGGTPERREVAGVDALATVLRDVFALAVPSAEVTAAAATAAAAQGTNPIFS
jgi:N-hydroxyarylamine O-acetyltransferase